MWFHGAFKGGWCFAMSLGTKLLCDPTHAFPSYLTL